MDEGGRMKQRKAIQIQLGLLVFVGATLLGVFHAARVSAQAEPFYKGKQMRIIPGPRRAVFMTAGDGF